MHSQFMIKCFGQSAEIFAFEIPDKTSQTKSENHCIYNARKNVFDKEQKSTIASNEQKLWNFSLKAVVDAKMQKCKK